jgi:magnesium-transporting ATPase (P-type)
MGSSFSSFGKNLIIAGIMIVIVGIVIYLFGNKMGWIGHLPGDIRVEKENFKLFVPFTTMILVSLVLTLLFYLLKKLF